MRNLQEKLVGITRESCLGSFTIYPFDSFGGFRELVGELVVIGVVWDGKDVVVEEEVDFDSDYKYPLGWACCGSCH